MADLSCGKQDLVAQARIKPRSPALGVQSLSHWATREVPSFASELNAVLFYWHDQHPAEGPFLGPNFKGLVTVANVLTVRNFKICIYDPEHFYRPQDSWSYPRLFQKRELETKVYAQALNAEWDTASGVKEREQKRKKSWLVKDTLSNLPLVWSNWVFNHICPPEVCLRRHRTDHQLKRRKEK